MTVQATPKALAKVDGYVRVSRVAGREGDAFISPASQREQIAAWAKMRGAEVVAWHEDLDASGGKLADRPGLDAALERIRSGETEAIAVAKLDRLSRAGVGDALALIEQIHGYGGQVVAIDLGIDPSTGFGEFAWSLMLGLAGWERRRLAEAWEEAKARALNRGAKVGRAPFGYARRADGTLEPHREEAPIVAEAFRLARGGVDAAVEYLQATAPGRTWSAFTVRRLLANETYIGRQVYAGQVHHHAQEPLVTVAAWTLAQHEPPERRRPPATFPLSGLATCGTCGAPMVGGRGGKAKDGTGLRTYRCSASLAKHKGTRCPAPATMVAHGLERVAWDRLLALTPELGTVVGSPADEGALAEAEVAMAEAEEELRAFAHDLGARRVLGDAWGEALEARAAVVEETRAAFRERAEEVAASGERIVPGLDVLEQATPEEAAKIIREVFARVIVQRGRGPIEGRVTVVLHDGWGQPLPPPGEDYEGGTVEGEDRPVWRDEDRPASLGDVAVRRRA